MNAVNQTLYIPLYGKAYVSKRGLFLKDPDAERIWKAQGFALGRKSRSKYLSLYMGIRAAVFDDWVRGEMAGAPDPAHTVVLHIGCGLDSRVKRVGDGRFVWYDMDFPAVIAERKRYFSPSKRYVMVEGDARETGWLSKLPKGGHAIVVMEGLTMYLTPEQNQGLQTALAERFDSVSLLCDCYSTLAAKMSRYKNPVNEVGVQTVWGVDDPTSLCGDGMVFDREHDMIPAPYVAMLKGMERILFRRLYAGRFARGLYRVFAYRKREAAQTEK